MGEWLKRRPVWQFALAGGLTTAFGCALGVFLGQLWKHQFHWAAASGHWEELLGAAVGGLAGGAFAAAAVRWNQRESAKLGQGLGPQ